MRSILFVVLTIFIFSCKTEGPVEFPTMKVTYPETRKDSIIDNYHGQDIPDPYRWLEDDMSDETAGWVTNQNNVTFDYLSKIPFKKDLENRLSELWDYEKYSSPFKEGSLYYYFKMMDYKIKVFYMEQKILSKMAKLYSIQINSLKMGHLH